MTSQEENMSSNGVLVCLPWNTKSRFRFIRSNVNRKVTRRLAYRTDLKTIRFLFLFFGSRVFTTTGDYFDWVWRLYFSFFVFIPFRWDWHVKIYFIWLDDIKQHLFQIIPPFIRFPHASLCARFFFFLSFFLCRVTAVVHSILIRTAGLQDKVKRKTDNSVLITIRSFKINRHGEW